MTIHKSWGDGSGDILEVTTSSNTIAIKSPLNDTGVDRETTLRVSAVSHPAIYSDIKITQKASLFGSLTLNLKYVWAGEVTYTIANSMYLKDTIEAKAPTSSKTAKIPAPSLEYWESMPSSRTEVLVFANGDMIGSFWLSPTDINKIKAGTDVTVLVDAPL